MSLPRILCIVGPTSSGKTSLSLRVAKKFQGEIINADARQLYKGFTIGTGKPMGEWLNMPSGGEEGLVYLVEEIPQHLMDILEPTETMTVAEWREQALIKIQEIIERGHLPIVVGGTGLFIRSLVDGLDFPKVPPQPSVRAELGQKTLSELIELLLKHDPQAAEKIDLKNPRRVIRALEVYLTTGRPFTEQQKKIPPVVEAFQIGIQWPREELYQRIDAEVDSMIHRGWIEEVRTLLAQGVAIDVPAMTSIGYRELAKFIQQSVIPAEAGIQPSDPSDFKETIKACKQAIHNYAKRQETWFKKDKTIHWAENEYQAMKMIEEWLRNLR